MLHSLRSGASGPHRVSGESIALASVASSAVLWGSIGLAVRAVDMSAIAITFYRVLLGAVSILLIIALRGRLAELRVGSRAQLGRLALMAAFYTLNWVLLFYAVQLTTISIAVLAYYTAPAFMAVFGAIFLKESLDRRTIVCIGIAFAGLYLILSPGGGEGSGSLAGALVGAGAGISYAAAVVTAKPLRNSMSPWGVAMYQTAGATLLLLPFMAVDPGSAAVAGDDWVPLLMLGLVHTTLAFWLFFGGIRGLDAKLVGVIMYLDPLTAVALSIIILDEPLTPATAVGGALIIAAGLASVLGRRVGFGVRGPRYRRPSPSTKDS